MKNIDRVTSMVFILIGIIFFIETFKLPENSRMYPRFMIGIMVFLSVLLLIKSFVSPQLSKTWRDLTKDIHWKRFLFVLFGALVYLFLINIIGFFVSTFVYLLTTMLLLKAKRSTMIISVCSFLIILFLIFKVFLKVPLPTGYLI